MKWPLGPIIGRISEDKWGTYDDLIMRPGFVYLCVCICFSHGSVFKRVWGRMVRTGPFIHPSTHSCRSLLPYYRMGWRYFWMLLLLLLLITAVMVMLFIAGVNYEWASERVGEWASRRVGGQTDGGGQPGTERTLFCHSLCTLLPKRAGAL